MSEQNPPVPEQHVQTAKASGQPLFELGQVVATVGVLAHLEKHGVFPSVLLSQHCHGDWGVLGAADAQCNDAAVLNGGRILSAYVVEGVRILAITEAQSDEPNKARPSTCLLFPSEY
jgi:hypothetical protein